MKRLLRRLFGKRYAKGGEVPPRRDIERMFNMSESEGFFIRNGNLYYWVEKPK